MDESQTSRMSCLYVPEYAVRKPLLVKKCEKAQKVRALGVNRLHKVRTVTVTDWHEKNMNLCGEQC